MEKSARENSSSGSGSFLSRSVFLGEVCAVLTTCHLGARSFSVSEVCTDVKDAMCRSER